MKHLALALAAGSIALAGAGGTLAAPARYEGVVIPATSVQNTGFFRVNVATGQVWVWWAGSTQFAAVVDTPPPPPGEYHIFPGVWTAPDAKVSWSLNRLDALSGRTWVATGGGAAPLVWTELTPPK